jgi:NADH-quinone oxidoreductase subunit M
MICHGVSTGALFILVGALQERLHTREMDRMEGLWAAIPRLSGAALFFALASLGLPGLGDFVGEFLVLLGVYPRSILIAALAAVGVLGATFYALRLVQRAFHGPNTHGWQVRDLLPREAFTVASWWSRCFGWACTPARSSILFSPRWPGSNNSWEADRR